MSKSMKNYDPIDALESLYKGFPPPKKKKAAPEQDEEAGGQDVDGDGDADTPGEDEFGGSDQDDVYGKVADDDEDGDEGEDGDVEASDTDEDTDDDGDVDGEDVPELPTDDDGKNRGVGDLGGDGDAGSLLSEIAEIEKAYYAAKGLHGAGHHKTERALDLYHRAVRKIVRAMMGEGNPDAPEEGAEGEGPPGEEQEQGGDEQGPPGAQKGPPGAKKPPFGQKAATDQDEAESASPGGEDDEGHEGNDEDEDEGPPKKKPPFGKSLALDPIDRLALEYGSPEDRARVLQKAEYRHDDFGVMVATAPAANAPSTRPHPRVAPSPTRYTKMSTDPLASGAPGLALTDDVQPALFIDDAVNPIEALHKSRAASIARMYKSSNATAHVTVDANCPMHGHDVEFQKSQVLAHPYLRCTCR